MLRYWFFSLWLLLLPLGGWAQARTELWTRLTLTHAVGKHWQLWTDLQYRRQANYLAGSHNLLDRPLAYTGRVWIGYKLPHKTMVFLSPGAIFETIGLASGGDALVYGTEYRATVGVLHNHTLGKIESRIRLMNESRFFLTTNTTQQRPRLLGQILCPVYSISDISVCNLLLADEVFAHLNPGAGAGYDHNRITAALQLTRHKHDLTAGYQWHNQPTVNQPLNRHIFFCNISLVL